ncbi:hypothetical protein COV93_00665 [Candidatus Woesearchaeota archaeon CG11_big_fil_rev_8_21_14_0_20_43_8]|nr:MAG: hypothetical protein COV93_00665 [Candidatus Woesearchaeota archaeon CG11_big_fil_rev_8_21_14_0_20_43_8]PIO06796.1 MAG: hypothetical protein COT47_02700 [Candidatus Woesearchaeota archaeon CG08_land_8_20_14_0_20_43_7]
MEKFRDNLKAAVRSVSVADHMLTQTYPLIKDEKLLIGVTDKIRESCMKAFQAALDYEHIYNQVPPYHESYGPIIEAFAKYCKKYKVDKDSLDSARNVGLIIDEHKRCPVEFTRKGQFVICSDDYDLKKVSVRDLSRFISTTKEIITKIQDRIDASERLFRRGTKQHTEC